MFTHGCHSNLSCVKSGTHLKLPCGSLHPLPGHHRAACGQQVPDHGVRGSLSDVTHKHSDTGTARYLSPRSASVVSYGLARRSSSRWHPSAHRRRAPHPHRSWAKSHARRRTSDWRRRSIPGHFICKQRVIVSQRMIIKYRKAQERENNLCVKHK